MYDKVIIEPVQERVVNNIGTPAFFDRNAGRCAQNGKLSIPANGERLAGKRMFDITSSLLLLLTVVPVIFPFIAFFIVCTSKGGIFFLQKRNGRNGKVFNCIKFRSMYENEHADMVAAAEFDLRITPVGRFLRITGLDELPQLINVLKGDMSIVGPRPHMISENRMFGQVIPEYGRRHLVKPGITGLAQVRGYKGPSGNADNIRMRVKLDLLYIRKMSWALDMRIIMQTFKIMITEAYKCFRRK